MTSPALGLIVGAAAIMLVLIVQGIRLRLAVTHRATDAKPYDWQREAA